MRLVVARCEVTYTGRLTAHLPESTRLLMIKEDGTFMVWSDSGGAKVKPLNWMTPPTAIEEEDGRILVRKRAGKTEDCLDIRLVEVLSDVSHEMGEAAGLEKDGVERDLQEVLAAQPEALGEELRLVKREWPTDIGPVDLMCRDADDDWVAVEIKRIAGIEAVEQLARYLERIQADPDRARGARQCAWGVREPAWRAAAWRICRIAGDESGTGPRTRVQEPVRGSGERARGRS